MIILTDVRTLYTGNSATHTVNLHFLLCTSAKVTACILQKKILRDPTHWIDWTLSTQHIWGMRRETSEQIKTVLAVMALWAYWSLIIFNMMSCKHSWSTTVAKRTVTKKATRLKEYFYLVQHLGMREERGRNQRNKYKIQFDWLNYRSLTEGHSSDLRHSPIVASELWK